MIRQLTSKEREAFAKLTHYAFEPTNNSYESVVKEDFEQSQPHLKDMSQVYGYFIEDILVATTAFFESNIVIRKKELAMSGIWGVATTPTFRNKGLVATLLKRILQEMNDRQIWISILYPFKFSFYEKFGWKLANINYRYHFRTEELKYREEPDRKVVEVEDLDEIKKCYDSIVVSHKYNYMLRRAEDQWRGIINPKSPGYMFICYDSQRKPKGYIILRFLEHESQWPDNIYKSEETLYVKEIFWQDRKTKQALFNFLRTHRDHRNFILVSIPEPNMLNFLKEARIQANENFPGSMARIVNVKEILESLDYSEDVNITFEVTDRHCEWNNKSFSLKVQNRKAMVNETNTKSDVCLDIGSLSQMVVGFRTASQLHDSWELEASEDTLTLLDRLFPSCVNFFRDFF